MTQDEITEAQRQIRLYGVTPRTARQYRCLARWWELDARRGYPSSDASLRYARNMRWAAELAGLHGDGAWLELIARAGVKNPEAERNRPARK